MTGQDAGRNADGDADLEVRVSGAGDTRDVGRRLATLLRAGDVLVLSGELGAGKTTFTQGLGAGLGVRGAVTSPTFVIARVHPSLADGPALVHVDAYRLRPSAGAALELDDLDLDADTEDAVTVVEWGAGLAEVLSEDRLEVELTRGARASDPSRGGADSADEDRVITVRKIGARWAGVDLGSALVPQGVAVPGATSDPLTPGPGA